ncbi:MAG: hypothetical protein O3A46_03895 [Candidatus Poribacteria bacterium]|nr:hypothetical protein [Candidatus Poribacteria bacterium]
MISVVRHQVLIRVRLRYDRVTTPDRNHSGTERHEHLHLATRHPTDANLNPDTLRAQWDDLKANGTKAYVVARGDRLVFEGYHDHDFHQPHYTASMAKALVGGLSLDAGDGRLALLCL